MGHAKPVGDQRRRDRDLTIPDLAQRPTILPLDTDRRLALFREARIVDRENPAADRQVFAQAAPEGPHLPRRMGDEVLQSLVVPGIAQPAMHRLHRLALAVVEQPAHIPTRIRALRASSKAAGELIEKRAEPFQQRARRWIGHASEHRKFRRSVQENLTK